MSKNIDLTKILRNCPKNIKFWSPLFGEVELSCIENKSITVKYKDGTYWNINSNGTMYLFGVMTSDIMLYPSREMRDWDKFEAPWLKKDRFDPKTLNPFDKVLVRSENIFNWNCSLFSNIDDFSSQYPFSCLGTCYRFCIPYNDETKHLVGTNEEAPEYYRYWED